MEKLLADGLSLLPELAEDAVLTSNLLPESIHGREDVAKFILSVAAYCASVADLERLNTPSHFVVESRATLKTGQKMDVTAVGMRDSHGRISDVLLDYQSDKSLDGLAEVVQNLIR